MTVQATATGLYIATGGADNIQVGFIPDIVKMYQMSNPAAATLPTISIWVRMKVAAFTSGGITEVVPGDTIQGATAKLVRAEVRKVYLSSGTWAGGDAAGSFFWQDWNQNGTFGSENVDLLDTSATVAGGGGIRQANVAGVTPQTELGNFILTGHATATSTSFTYVTPANGIQPYSGTDGGDSEGFTVTATLSTVGNIYLWEATRGTLTL